MSELVDLADYRRRVQDLYHAARHGPPGRETWMEWRAGRDHLFRSHPQSALDDDARGTLRGLEYYDYDPTFAVTGLVEQTTASARELEHSGPGATSFDPIGRIVFSIAGRLLYLTLYWLSGYGGGVFLPFTDETSGVTTYRGGRYLLDGAKGADLGGEGSTLVLDFNYAYHPSCVHSPRWSCPLAPAENRLDIAINAGERLA